MPVRDFLNNPHWKAGVSSLPSYAAVASRKRKARVLAVGEDRTATEWEALKAQYDYTCLCCGQREPEIVLTFDHVVLVSMGGSNGITNGQPLCQSCNSTKHAKVLDDRGTR